MSQDFIQASTSMDGDIKSLRNRYTGGRSSRFRKSFLGGYNKRDIDEYMKTAGELSERAEQAYNERIEEYSGFMDALKEEKDKLSTDILTKEKQISSLLNDIDSLKADNERLSLANEEKNRLAADLLAKDEQAAGLISDMNRIKADNERLSLANEEKNRLMAELLAKDEQAADLISDINRIKADNEQLMRLKEENTLQIDELKKFAESTERAVLLSENASLKQNLIQLAEERDKLSGENAVLLTKQDDLTTKLADLRFELDKVKEELANQLNLRRGDYLQTNLLLCRHSEKQDYAYHKLTENMEQMLQLFQELQGFSAGTSHLNFPYHCEKLLNQRANSSLS